MKKVKRSNGKSKNKNMLYTILIKNENESKKKGKSLKENPKEIFGKDLNDSNQMTF